MFQNESYPNSKIIKFKHPAQQSTFLFFSLASVSNNNFFNYTENLIELVFMPSSNLVILIKTNIVTTCFNMHCHNTYHHNILQHVLQFLSFCYSALYNIDSEAINKAKKANT